MNLREFLQTNTLIFDGGMGTYYAARNRSSHVDCEWANLTNPDEVAAIHKAYLDAGCQAIKTNTYCVNRLNYSEDENPLALKSDFVLSFCELIMGGKTGYTSEAGHCLASYAITEDETEYILVTAGAYTEVNDYANIRDAKYIYGQLPLG